MSTVVLQCRGAALDIFILETILDYAKNIFLPLEIMLLGMGERISETLQVVCEVQYTV
jgi:hypothetical protein